MDHDLVLEGRVVTPQGLEEMEIGVNEGVIAHLGHGLKGARRIRTGRSLIFPGFVDMHVHLREPGWEYKEDFRSGSLAAAHGGVTTVADMPNNPSPTTTASAVELKKRLAREKSKIPIVFYGGVVADELDLVKSLAEAVVAFKVYLSETTGARAFPTTHLLAAFREIAKAGRPVSVHCEGQSVIDRVRSEQARGNKDVPYADLRPPEAEVSAAKDVIDAVGIVSDARVNICHSSLADTVSMVRAARAKGSRVHCEVALHHLYFDRKSSAGNSMLKTNPPFRSAQDRDALLQGLRDGAVPFLVTDHAPHTEQEKLRGGAAGVPGLDDYSHVVSWLIKENGVQPSTVAAVASGNPARFLGLADRGEVSMGKRADLTVLDLHSPEKVRNEDLQSRCGWSPYEGREFPGRARWTISGGNVLVDDFELVT